MPRRLNSPPYLGLFQSKQTEHIINSVSSIYKNNSVMDNSIICEVCELNITQNSEIYKCLECYDFFMCAGCFYSTRKENNTDDFGTKGVLTSTRDWHIHPFTVILVEIFTPSKKRYRF